MLVGALIAVMPFLGFTIAMQMWIIFILGVIVIALGIALRRRGERQARAQRRGEFVESIPADPVRRSTKTRVTREAAQVVEAVENREDDSVNG